MKNRDLKYKAEDWLTEEQLLGEVKGSTSTTAQDGQLKIAVWFYRALQKGKQVLKPRQKKQLGDKIQQSIQSYRRKIFLRRFSVAASFLLFSGISYIYLSTRESAIQKFADNAIELPTDGTTQLYLAGEKSIAINSEDSEIDYSESGNVIEIDASKQIQQEVDSKELVLNTVVVPYGKRSKVKLSDNTSVWLNSGSKLIFPAKFEKSKREVYLQGEAIFDVTHDAKHPFHVHTDNLEVQVLGTLFNLSAYNDDVETSTVLVEGSVELSYQGTSLLGKTKSTIVPGTLASYSAQGSSLKQENVDTHIYTSWREGYLIFRQQPLPDILKKVSRYYNVKIKMEDPVLAMETFSGNLDLKNSAVDLLEIVGEIIHASVEQQDDQIVITRI